MRGNETYLILISNNFFLMCMCSSKCFIEQPIKTSNNSENGTRTLNSVLHLHLQAGVCVIVFVCRVSVCVDEPTLKIAAFQNAFVELFEYEYISNSPQFFLSHLLFSLANFEIRSLKLAFLRERFFFNVRLCYLLLFSYK